MIVAGAGSGKTKVLTTRIAHLMSKGVDAFNILALTFTNKAAAEMKERIGHILGNREARNLYIGTFHSVFARILRTEAPRLYSTLREIADAIAAGRTDYANLEAAARADLARHGWKVDYIAVRNGIGLRIPHPEGFDHPNLLIVLGAATLGTTRLIDNVDVIRKDGED